MILLISEEPLPRVAEPSAAWGNDSSIVLSWRMPLLGSCVKAVVVMVAKDRTHVPTSDPLTTTTTMTLAPEAISTPVDVSFIGTNSTDGAEAVHITISESHTFARGTTLSDGKTKTDPYQLQAK
jgi:hypothetical protein